MMRTEPGQILFFTGTLSSGGVTAGQPVGPEAAMFAALFHDPQLRLAAETEAAAMDEVAVGIDGFRATMVGAPEPVQPADQADMTASNEAAPSLHSFEKQPDLSQGVAGGRLGGARMLPGRLEPMAWVSSSAVDLRADPMPMVETVVSGVGADLPAPGDGATRVSAPFDEPGKVLVGTSGESQKYPTRLAESPPEVVKHAERDAAPMPGASTLARGAEKVDAPFPQPEASAGAEVVKFGEERNADPTDLYGEVSKPAQMRELPVDRQQEKHVALQKDRFGKNPEGSLASWVLATQPPEVAAVMPVSTEAERFWLGRLNWQASPFPEIGRGPMENVAPTSMTEPEASKGQDRSPRLGMATEPETARLLGIVALAAETANPSLYAEPDQMVMNWTPAGQPGLPVSPAAGPSPTVTIPQFAAGIIATLHQQADGTTEIVLSPDELGSVRLRLEPDVRNPERMIVHLVFDRPETMDLFRRHADQLSDAIRTAGYSEAMLDFGQPGTGEDARSGQGPYDGGKTPAVNETDPGTAATFPGHQVLHRLADAVGLDLRL